MDSLWLLIDVGGGVALLLWGTHMVQTGVQRAFGPNLRGFLGRALRNRIMGFCAGLVVTALLQSSTATGLMISGFAAAGAVELVPALAVMLGANVGTTLIVQVLSFDVSPLAPLLILVGVALFRRNRANVLHDVGRLIVGLGLMLLALHQITHVLTPYEDTPSLRAMLGIVATLPLLLTLLAAGLTWLAHSSVAMILVVMSLAAKGAVAPEAAFALVLGANLGSAINPVIEGTTGGGPASRRLPLGNLAVRAVGAAAALAFLDRIGPRLVAFEPDPARAVADFHVVFNAGLALLLLPLLSPYARLLTRALPQAAEPADPARPLYLDSAAIETPIVALGAAAREALRLTDMLEAMLDGIAGAIAAGQRRDLVAVKSLGRSLGRLCRDIQAYLSTLDPEELNEDDHRRLTEIFAFASNLSYAGKVAEKTLLPMAAKRLKLGAALSRADRAEVGETLVRSRNNVRTAATLLMTDDPRAARTLAAEKRTFRSLETEAAREHFDQLRAGSAEGAFKAEFLRALKQVNGYLVAGAAYPILDRNGGLLDSRIATDA